MFFRHGGEGGGEGEAAGCLLLTEVEEEVGEIALLYTWGIECIWSFIRLARLALSLGLVVKSWTLFMSSGLQC